MWLFYFLIFLTLALYYFNRTVDKKHPERVSRRYLAEMFAILGFLIMFRAAFVGNDTDDYARLYKTINSVTRLSKFVKESRFEIGFIYMTRALGKISDDPQLLFIVTGFITAFSFARFFYRYSEMPWLSVLMFMTLQFYDLALTGVRQMLAISILLFSYDFILKKKPVYFIATVLVASLIHTSAVMFFVMYPMCMGKKTNIFYIVTAAVAGVMYFGFETVISLLDRVFPQYVKYFTEEGDSYKTSATLAIALMLIMWFIMFVISRVITGSTVRKARNIGNITDTRPVKINGAAVENMMEISIWLSVIMLLLALRGTILGRFKYVFSAAMLVYYPNVLNRIEKKEDRQIIIFCSCAVFLAYILVIYTLRPDWQSSFPYYFCWS